MSRFLKVLLAMILITALVAPVWAQVNLPPPFPPQVAPMWAAAPTSPSVLYAPNAVGDIFRHGRYYYYFYGGRWHRGKSLMGPWWPVSKLPRSLLKLHPSLFKSPPPW